MYVRVPCLKCFFYENGTSESSSNYATINQMLLKPLTSLHQHWWSGNGSKVLIRANVH